MALTVETVFFLTCRLRLLYHVFLTVHSVPFSGKWKRRRSVTGDLRLLQFRLLAFFHCIGYRQRLLDDHFLDAVIPVCEEVGVRMACHPDDPAWPIFGLPRIAHSQEDYDKIIKLHDSPANTVCLCTGSLGSNPENDVPAAIRHFGEMDRIGAMHVRNVKYLGYHHFREAAHLSSTGDLDMYAIMKAIHDTCPDTYVRPDHGRMIWDERGRPGYGLYDRALGAAYLNGLWEAIEKQ